MVHGRLRGVRVLVVDDALDGRDLLTYALEREGAEVRGALSAREALTAVTSWTPTVLVLDLHMPEIDGHELLRMLRARPELAVAPALALTAAAGEGDRVRALQAGFQVHVPKPCDLEDVAATILGLHTTPLPPKTTSIPAE